MGFTVTFSYVHIICFDHIHPPFPSDSFSRRRILILESNKIQEVARTFLHIGKFLKQRIQSIQKIMNMVIKL
jgi:hypothetical protein